MGTFPSERGYHGLTDSHDYRVTLRSDSSVRSMKLLLESYTTNADAAVGARELLENDRKEG